MSKSTLPMFLARVLRVAGVAMVFPAAPLFAAAPADYPSKPIRIVVGFSAGSLVDVSARVIGQKLTETLKQPVIVENRPAAAGIVAAQIVASGSADGYTLLSVSAGHAVAPAIYAKLPHDVLKDFSGITSTVNTPAVLIVNPALGVRSVSDLIAAAKAKPGAINFASAGIGSATHFSAELFKTMAGIDVVHVPYKGIPEAIADTMTGRVQYFLAPVAIALPLIKEGKILALAVSTAKRSAVLPDVPTIAEAGVVGYRWDTWFGLLAPAKTPRALVTRLNREITQVLELADVRQRWTALGAEAIPSTAEEFDKRIAEQVTAFAKLARAAGIKAN